MNADLTITEMQSGFGSIMPLLLMGDESEEMIDCYINRGVVYTAVRNGATVAVCVVTEEPDGWVEIKNLAVVPHMRRKGIGHAMLVHVESQFPDRKYRLGTGETPSTLRFYESCGYRYAYRIADFFTDNYKHPIVEEGVRLKDMLYLTKT